LDITPFVTVKKMSTAVAEQTSKRGERFFHSVMWSWFGVAVSIFSGIFLSAYVIHKVGHVAAGVWALIFSVVENFGVMDFGFRSATLKYAAHYRALEEPDKVNETLNTALAFSISVSFVTIAATLLFVRQVTRFENISPEYADVFTILLVMVGLGWATGALFNPMSALLEGYQRFDLSSRIWIASMAVRALGIVLALATGHGLIDMGKAALAALAATYSLTFFAVRRVFPQLRFSPRLVTYSMFRQLLHYGLHTFGATVGLQVLNQSAPMLIGHFMPSSAFVVYFTQPQRLLNYSVDMVGRVGFITGSHTAELAAKEDYVSIARMGIFINRYCFMLFTPLALALIVYGPQLFRVWIDARFASMCAPLLPVMAVATTLAIAAQFNSSSILYGLGRHQGYAYSQMAEAAFCVVGLCWAIPRYGILGAAWVVSVLLALNRGMVLSWLLCRAVRFSLWKYLSGIYVAPLLAAIPTLFLALWIRQNWIPGNNLREVIEGGALLAAVYYAIAYFVCLEAKHRSMPVNWVRVRLLRRAA
jgi:O-antigen/teichoic acid export membrane protein